MATHLEHKPAAGDLVTFDDDWRAWIAENLVRGETPADLLTILVDNDFHPAEAQREIDEARRSPYLKPAHQLLHRIAKRDWTLEVQRRTRALLPHGPDVIPRRRRIARANFLKEHYSANRPAIITGMMDDWPAMRWTPEALAKRFADRIVQVQTNRNANSRYEIESGKHLETLRFGDFMRCAMAVGESNDLYMTANNGGANAAHMTELWEDIVQIPEYLTDADAANRGFSGWVRRAR